MDIKEIALKICRGMNPYSDLHESEFIYFANKLIESYKAELLKEVGEPVAHMIEHKGKCMGFLPTKEQGTIPVFASDQLAAAIIKATKPLEDQLAAAQEETRLLTERNATNEEYAANLVRELTKTQDQLAKAEQRVAEAIATMFDESGTGGIYLAEMVRNSDWRKFVKEV